MKNFSLVFVFCLASVIPAHLAAQSFRLTANIPFAFVMDGRTMPAGEYILEAGTFARGTVLVRSEDRKLGAMAILAPVAAGPDENATPRLTFDHYADQYFLAQISLPGASLFELNTAGEEHKAGTQQAANHHETVTVLATR